MTDGIKAGSVLIKEGASLPEVPWIESEPCLPAWRLVRDLNGNALDRNLRGVGWAFFRAGEIKATVFGNDAQQMVHRAVEAILAGAGAEKFNSLEIADVTSAGSERFPGVSFLTVAANKRHIQKDLALFDVEKVRQSGSSRNTGRPNTDAGLTSGNGLSEEMSKWPALIAVSNP